MSIITSLTRTALIKRILHHQLKTNNLDLIESTEAATSQLRWLEEAAQEHLLSRKDSSKSVGDILTGMVNDLVTHHKPLAYIIGNQPFHPLPLPLLTRPPTLIPRPETEHWTNLLSTSLISTFSTSSNRLTTSKEAYNVLDIGTGTGCIPLGLYWALKEVCKITAIGVDRDEAALSLAKENVQRCLNTLKEGKRKELDENGINPVRIIKGDLWNLNFVESMRSELGGRSGKGFDLIVSNPPYITKKDYESLDLNVKNWEDRKALVGEKNRGCSDSEVDDGLIFYQKISELAIEVLESTNTIKQVVRRPVIVLEVGKGQSKEVENLLIYRGFKTEIWKDPWNIDRTVIGFRN